MPYGELLNNRGFFIRNPPFPGFWKAFPLKEWEDGVPDPITLRYGTQTQGTREERAKRGIRNNYNEKIS